MVSLNSILTKVFYKLGWKISHHPKKSILLPFVVTCIISLGARNAVVVTDFEELYTPTVGPSIKEREVADTFFKSNDSGFFDAARKKDFGRFLR